MTVLFSPGTPPFIGAGPGGGGLKSSNPRVPPFPLDNGIGGRQMSGSRSLLLVAPGHVVILPDGWFGKTGENQYGLTVNCMNFGLWRPSVLPKVAI